MNKGKLNLIVFIIALLLLMWQMLERRDNSEKNKESIEKVLQLDHESISIISIHIDNSDWGDGRRLSEPTKVLNRNEIIDFMNILSHLKSTKLNHPNFKDTHFIKVFSNEQYLLKVDFLHDRKNAYMQLNGVPGYYSSRELYQFLLEIGVLLDS